MQSAPRRAALVGMIVAALVTLPALGMGTLWDNSETAYGEVAREILLLHDPVVMHFNAQPWFIQPPLYFWLAALCAKLWGLSSFTLRLPSALATIAMGGLVSYATARIAGTRAGIFSGLVLSTCLMQAVMGRLAIMDALLDLCVAAALLLLFRGLEPEDWRLSIERRRTGAWYLGWVAMAFGLLAKGPVAVVIPLLVIAIWVWWERRDGRMVAFPPWYEWLIALFLFALVAAPWFVILDLRGDANGIASLIGHYSVGRYVGTIEGQSGPVWYYVPALILGFFPWIAFLPAAFARALREGASDRDASLVRLVLVWSVVPFLFFSFAQTKLPNYIALELPALAILVGLWFERVVNGEMRRAAIISGAVVPVALGALALGLAIFSEQMRLTADITVLLGDIALLGIITFAGSLLTLGFLARARSSGRAPVALAATMTAVMLVIVLVSEPRVERFKPIPALASVINSERRPNDVVVIQGVAGGNALLFYTAPPVVMLAPAGGEGSAQASRVLCQAERAFYVAPKDGPLPDASGRDERLIAASGRDGLFLYDGQPCAMRASEAGGP